MRSMHRAALLRAICLLAAALLLTSSLAACGEGSGEDPGDVGGTDTGDAGADTNLPNDTGAADTGGDDDTTDPDASDTGGGDDVTDTTAGDTSTTDTSSADTTDTSAMDTSAMDTAEMDTSGDMDTADMMLPPGLPDGPSSERQTARPLGSVPGAPQGYHEYLPVGYGDTVPRPLLLFFHGIGENGDGTTQLDDVLVGGPPRYINRDEWPSDRPFIVLSPQHSGGGCPSANEIATFLDFARGHYDIDPTRIYMTGLSCGGIGLWGYLGAHHGDNLVAAAVPIAGDGRGAWNNAGCGLGEVAIWAFHGDADPTVNVDGTNVPVDNLLADCPSPPRLEVLKTIYPGVGHNSWSQTYSLSAGHDIYAWLLTKTNDDAPPLPMSASDPLASGRSILIDFGGTAAAAAAPWANVTTANGSLNDLADDMGAVTTTDVAITQAFAGVNEQGLASNTVGYPGAVSSDMLWMGSFDGHAAGLLETASLELRQLAPNQSYTLELYAARTGDDGGIGRLTRYTVNGGDFQDLDASDNDSQVATFTGVTADANGVITLDVTVSPDGTGRFGYLGGLVLTRD